MNMIWDKVNSIWQLGMQAFVNIIVTEVGMSHQCMPHAQKGYDYKIIALISEAVIVLLYA